MLQRRQSRLLREYQSQVDTGSSTTLSRCAYPIDWYASQPPKGLAFPKPRLLLGTKIDLRETITICEDLPDQQVPQGPLSVEHGVKLAREIGAVCYMECSALTQQNLPDVFEEAVRTVLKPKPRAAKRKQCVVL